MKKTWEKPQLIVLLRNRPEEAVLTHCKRVDTEGGPDSAAHACDTIVNNNCGNCAARSGS